MHVDKRNFKKTNFFINLIPLLSLSTPFFWLRLRVVASDGTIRVLTRRVNIWECPEANENPVVEDRSAGASVSGVGLYPNPAADVLYVAQKGVIGAILNDALGRVVRTENLNPDAELHTLPIFNLAPGVYSLTLISGNHALSKHKFIVHRP
jgi:Secretion system C-terminal sorting domain